MNETIGHLIRGLCDPAEGNLGTRLWVGNLSPGTTDAELRAFLQKYGLPPCSAILRVPGDGSSPGALVSFDGVEPEMLCGAALRLDGMYWKQREISVSVLQH